MTRTRSVSPAALLLLAALGLGGRTALAPVNGAEMAVAQDTLAEIRQRFEQRYRELFKLKQEGRIGETFTGYVELVADVYRDEDRTKLIQDENRDRARFYELLAKDLRDDVDEEQRKRVTPQMIARRNAKRNFQNAKPFEYLKMPDGVWIQKTNDAAYEEVLTLKDEGAIGETAEGYLAVRRGDGPARDLAEQENGRRREFYGKIAKLSDDSLATIAAKRAEDHFKAARPGDWLRTTAGEWIRARRAG